MSGSQSSSFELLDERIRRWIWSEGWTDLRDAQEKAIPAILPADRDVIVAAATAAGKTEAAFLPVLTRMLQEEPAIGVVLYISPLKALINDQFGRLERLCESLDIPVWPWHGDISSSLKSKFLKRPSGVLLITPESVEALLCNRGFNIPSIFAKLRYIVVDELHAFIGTERGKQLQSLMQRIEDATGQVVTRVGLSATLGDMSLAASFLRPHSHRKFELVESKSGGGELQISVKGYLEAAVGPETESEEASSAAEAAIATHLFKVLRGANNLVFPNSRRQVEAYTYKLKKLCEQANVPNEFWPHHGSLSKEIREETEAALKNKEQRTTAVCTNTLELGIDIGAVKSVAQIGPPPSVASLRQRLGRSGRRAGEPAILRAYAIESELTAKSHLLTQLRVELVELVATITLLIERWFEPPITQGLHLSTLVQQILSLISQRGGISAANAYGQLCARGPFSAVSKSDFISLLKHLGMIEIIQQDSSGILLHGAKGEPLVNHYTFYASFASDDEYRVISQSRTLGSLPISSTISVGDFILFAAKTWRVEQIDEESKTIYVSKYAAGKPPTFSGGGRTVHDKVVQRMRELYEDSKRLPGLDEAGLKFVEEGRGAYRRYSLGNRTFIQQGSTLLLFTWLGDRANEAIAAMLRRRGYRPMVVGPAIEIMGAQVEEERILDIFLELAQSPAPAPEALLLDAFNLRNEKWDWALPEDLLMRSYASMRLDIKGAHDWLQKLSKSSV